jgi:hypothetical protein
MNLRRELRTKFEDVLGTFGMDVPEREPLADLLADAALSVAGIAKQERTDDIMEQANRKIDAMLDMANFPGAKREARVNSILSYLGETFHKNVETKEWREFAKYIDGEHTSKGWDVKRFIEWLYGQRNFDLQYWPVKKMRENYPAAFVNDVAPERTESSGYYA